MVCYFGGELGVFFDDLLNQKVNQPRLNDLTFERNGTTPACPPPKDRLERLV